MAKYIVTAGPLEHDLKTFNEGDEVNLAKEAAEPLVAVGVLAPKSTPAPAPAAQE